MQFRAELQPSGRGGGGHLVKVPDPVIAGLGGKGRIPVRATFNGVPYRGSVVKMGGSYVLGVTKAITEEAQMGMRESIDVTLHLDTQERTVSIPRDLQSELARDASARAAWDRLSFTRRKEHVQAIEGAKKPETRARRLQRTLDELTQGAPRRTSSRFGHL